MPRKRTVACFERACQEGAVSPTCTHVKTKLDMLTSIISNKKFSFQECNGMCFIASHVLKTSFGLEMNGI